jgi:lactate dehydrogenase-like 2-hydroxyacid dehydrogenase
MPKPQVFVTRKILEQGLKLIEKSCQVDVWPDEEPPSQAQLLERVHGVDGLLCLLSDRIDAAVMDAAGPGLKVISTFAVGVDNIDLAAATARGIPVGNAPGILTDATADMTFALLLAAARRVVEGERMVRNGKWKSWGPSVLLGADLRGATLGIVGFGRIGQAVAKRATGFDMRILFTEPRTVTADPDLSAEQVDLNTLLAESDFVSLHCPLTDATRGLINAAALARMKPTAILVNTSRGAVVDQTALYAALKNRRLFAAAIDVTDPEPLPLDSPLLGLDNLIVTPHIASAGRKTREKLSEVAAENLLAGMKGTRLPFCVNPEAYKK